MSVEGVTTSGAEPALVSVTVGGALIVPCGWVPVNVSDGALSRTPGANMPAPSPLARLLALAAVSHRLELPLEVRREVR